MGKQQHMLDEAAVKMRAKTRFDRNWRAWASAYVLGGKIDATLGVDLKPPREKDLETREGIAEARAWVEAWRACPLQEGVEWASRAWPRVGTQRIPLQVRLESPEAIACWAGREKTWQCALRRLDDVRARCVSEVGNLAESGAVAESGIADAVRESIAGWCEIDDATWSTALDVLVWLVEHPNRECYARQLPIRGVDTKWIEHHGRHLRPLYRALTGCKLEFKTSPKQFFCKACDQALYLAGCDEFSLSARQVSKLRLRPKALLVCENLVNVLSLPAFEGVLALHGGGYAVQELREAAWIAEIPVLYWGDLDSNGFAILDMLRMCFPHVESVMMDACTLQRYLDLCVEEPRPAAGNFAHLTDSEREALAMLSKLGSPQTSEHMRLEQERVEYAWACEQLRAALERLIA